MSTPARVARGGVHWADLGPVSGSAPARRRPVVVVQADAYNRSRLGTVAVAGITTNTALADLPGNVFLPAAAAGLSKDSCVNVTALVAVDRRALDDEVGRIPEHLMERVDAGLRGLLGL
ncbi:type II toxin-antitoxin system PemK/MazF family toxin [Demequina pelophila]|uniref:type II toxin-antitoxin system PemK/MazF family toxin n=1 Tax=Demequina pelophila TaxID=1638984 RepID=UPI0007844500|nr:type II toxin-antitoxin system PemK/MazF family toxin [Demequina pelophila]